MAQSNERENPGAYYDYMKECSRIFCNHEVFEGARFEMNKPVRPTEPVFSVSHSFTLQKPVSAEQGGSSYAFGANYIGKGQKQILMGRMDSDGILHANIISQWTKTLITRIQTQSQWHPGYGPAMHANVDIVHSGQDNTAQLRLLPFMEPKASFSYMQAITKELAAGTELTYRLQDSHSALGIVARYVLPDCVAAGKYDLSGERQLTYMHKISEQLNMGTELQWNKFSRTSVWRLGYEYTLTQARVRGQVESSGKVMCLLEEYLMMGVNFQISGQIDYVNNDYKFGVGLVVG